MNRLFTKLYLQFFSGLLVILAVAALSVYLLATNHLKQHAETRLQPFTELMQQGWASIDADQRENWLGLISSLSGTNWTQAESTTPLTGYTSRHAHLTASSVHAEIALDNQSFISADLSDWHNLEQTYGWLFLDAISREAADQREARFISLRDASPWPVKRVVLANEALPLLALRQLSMGESVHIPLSTPEQSYLYVPAGEGRALRFGPIKNYQLLPTRYWLIIIASSLILLSLGFGVLVKPLDQRFQRLFRAVDQISTTHDSIRLPADHDDELGQLAEHIDQMAHSLVQQIENNQRLNQAVSHDLKTPLARIRFSLALLDIPADDPYRQKIENDIDLLVSLTDELLQYHQLQNSQSTDEECDISALLSQRIAALPADVNVEIMQPEHPVMLNIQPGHWVRLTDNLLNNAVQYGRGAIRVSLNLEPEWVTLTVEDNGGGMSAEQFELMKQPFQRLETHRNMDGNNHGLGLALVDATAKHYQGQFRLQPGKLSGAAMSVVLPRGTAKRLQLTNNVGLA